MYLAYACVNEESKFVTKLCLVPNKPDPMSIPVPIDSLVHGEAAILHVGQGDTCTVEKDLAQNCIIIKPVSPSNLYLTPELPSKPGMHVVRIKLKLEGDSVTTYYGQSRDEHDTWHTWEPTKVRL